MTRDEHLDWAKKRALLPDTKEALTSMMSDVAKHPEMKNHERIELCVMLMMMGELRTPDEARKFIEGYH
jgi:hypothetical protein